MQTAELCDIEFEMSALPSNDITNCFIENFSIIV
jgi:hypothetical protein